LRNFRQNTSGIARIWAIGIIFIILGAVVYFPLSYTWDHVYTAIVGTYTFTGNTASGIALIKLIISYLLAFGVLITINWMIVNSKAEQYQL
jgi:glucan phosphoethanolaminetransferase (alkaline phosphatase superfamily)